LFEVKCGDPVAVSHATKPPRVRLTPFRERLIAESESVGVCAPCWQPIRDRAKAEFGLGRGPVTYEIQPMRSRLARRFPQASMRFAQNFLLDEIPGLIFELLTATSLWSLI
jgi:hypothetical protein